MGDRLVTHPKVAKVAFTGGDPTGRRVYQAAAAELKPVTLELGGKSPNIVYDDCRMDDAVKGVSVSNDQVSEVPSGAANTGDGSSQQPALSAASSGMGGDIALGGGIAAAALLGAYGVQMGRRRTGAHRSR